MTALLPRQQGRRPALRWAIPIVLGALLSTAPGRADVTLDGSLGPAGPVAPGVFDSGFGPEFADFLVTDDLGVVQQGHLFHSFDRFDLSAGQTALFVDTQLGTRPEAIRNVLARVTGGRSSIDGTIASRIFGADFFFLNREGVIFGPNAFLDVPAAMHVSNADFVRFTDGASFDDFETGPNGHVPLLASADPQAFGFLEGGALSFAVEPAIDVNGSGLVPSRTHFSFVAGGDLEIHDQAVVGVQNGQLTLVSVDSPGQVVFAPGIQGTPELVGFEDLGAITIDDAEADILPAIPGDTGSIVVRAGSLRLTGETRDFRGIFALSATATGAAIDIAAPVVEILNESGVEAFTLVDARAGDVSIRGDATPASRLEIRNGSRVSASPSGTIVVEGFDSVDLEGSTIRVFELAGLPETGSIVLREVGDVTLSGASAIDTGNRFGIPATSTGDVSIDARSVTLEEGSSVTTAAVADESLDPAGIATGGITISASEDVAIDGSIVSTAVGGALLAQAGPLDVKARNIEVRDGSFVTSSALVVPGLLVPQLGGSAGDISLDASGDLVIADSAVLASTTSFVELDGEESRGDISLAARNLELDGANVGTDTFGLLDAGNVDVRADAIALLNGSVLSSSTSGPGDAGRIVVRGQQGGQADGFQLEGRSVVFSNAQPSDFFGTDVGNAGSIDIAADSVVLRGVPEDPTDELRTGITSSALVAGGSSDSGAIKIAAGTLDVSEGAKVTTVTLSEGRAGTIELLADESISLSGRITELEPDVEIGETVVFSDTFGPGQGGGSATLDAPLVVVDDAIVSLQSLEAFENPNGEGRDAGSITVRGDEVQILGRGQLSTSTDSTGKGGDVVLEADRLLIVGDEPNAPIAFAAPGTAGISASSTLGSGDAGNIVVTAESIRVSQGAIAARSLTEGRGGNITLYVGDVLLLEDGSAVVANVTTADGANISIAQPKGVVLRDGSAIIAQAEEEGGSGGTIDITSDVFFASPDSIVSASAPGGPEFQGEVNIRSPVVNVEAGVTPLKTSFVDTASLLRATCAARGATDQGSFAVAARRGMPASPEGLLLAFDALGSGAAPGAPQATPAPAGSGTPGEPVEIAQLAWNRGAEAFRGGNFEEAEKQLAAASRHYAEGGDPVQRLDALRGLAQAQQARGEYAASLDTLREALTLAEQSGDPERTASVLGSLGNAQLALGDSEGARELLTRGIGMAKKSADRDLEAGLWNNLGNQQAAARSYTDAVSSYEEAARLAAEAGDGVKEAKALSNAARAALEAGHPAHAAALLARAGQKAQALPDSHEKAYVLIHLARSQQELARADAARERDGLLTAHALLQAAATLSKQLGDARSLSYAYGNLGALYEGQGRSQEALYFTHQALRWAEQADAPEALYRWHWQAGRLYWAEGRGNEAIRSYRRAVAILEETRQETLARYESSELYFRRAVAPVYNDLAEALLQGADMVDDPAAAQQLLGDAQDTVELLRAAELRDYFRDECVVEFQAQARPLAQVSPTAAVIYPILMQDRLEILLGLPGGLERVSVDVPRSQVEAAARRLRQQLQTPVGTAWQQDSQALYGWLVAPLAQKLEAAGVDTLVFVPDGALRTIPMAALHDGEHFLVERYALAVTPGLSLPDPHPLDVAHAGFLLAGVSESVQSFEPLPAVPQELDAIRDMYGGEVLLDQDFQLARFEREVAAGQPGVVHLATHAVFRGDSRESFLLTHDDRLTMEHLGDMVGRTRYREHPLELLTLSACETAAGDDRAALGLAGVAIRAGARSALGSLWTISDEATYQLVVQFYANLNDPSLSKAQALQRAQQELLASGTFSHPFYWSPFLLISNWL